MAGDPDSYSPFEGLREMFREKLGFITPLWIIRRPESLTILDYRPTFVMFSAVACFMVTAILFVLFFFGFGIEDSIGLWTAGIFGVGFLALSFRGTIREVYYFEKTTDSYRLVRQFIYRKEVIDGSMSQFTGAYVKTQVDDASEIYFVALKQEGMFRTGETEQILRGVVPLFNSFDNEARIANAISGFLTSKS